MIVKGKGYCLYALENGIPNSYRNKWVLLLYSNIGEGVTDRDAFNASFADMLIEKGVEVGDIFLINDDSILVDDTVNAIADPVLASYIVVPLTENVIKFDNGAYSNLLRPKGLMLVRISGGKDKGVSK